MLGGAVHDSLPCYASLPPLRDTKLVINETKRAIESGINAVTLHEVEIKYVSILRKEFDIIKALFPGGSITGAPKESAMQIIDQIENYN